VSDMSSIVFSKEDIFSRTDFADGIVSLDFKSNIKLVDGKNREIQFIRAVRKSV